MTQAQLQAESLQRARQSQSVANYVTIIQGFMDRGIPESEIVPRENVFTFHAWKELGRIVRKGEHGVRITTWIPIPDRTDKKTGEVRKGSVRPKTAYVFHLSQTDKL